MAAIVGLAFTSGFRGGSNKVGCRGDCATLSALPSVDWYVSHSYDLTQVNLSLLLYLRLQLACIVATLLPPSADDASCSRGGGDSFILRCLPLSSHQEIQGTEVPRGPHVLLVAEMVANLFVLASPATVVSPPVPTSVTSIPSPPPAEAAEVAALRELLVAVELPLRVVEALFGQSSLERHLLHNHAGQLSLSLSFSVIDLLIGRSSSMSLMYVT